MGGGDLNMKKSWHVSTFENIEKVWVAEQKAAAEKRKIEQLRKELEVERRVEELQQHAVKHGVRKKDDRLDWMYAGVAAEVAGEREEYLLGKVVSDSVMAKHQAPDVDLSALATTAGAAFMLTNNANSERDTDRKVRADPLFAIKKKEQEGIREIMTNPLRMKQLQQLREQMESKQKDKKHKKDKKHRKNKGDGGDSGDDSDTGAVKMGHRDAASAAPAAYRRHHSRPRSRSPRRQSPTLGEHGRHRSRSPRRQSPRRRTPTLSDFGRAGRADDGSHGASATAAGRVPAARARPVSDAEQDAARQQKLTAMMDNAKWNDEDRTKRLQALSERHAAVSAADEARDARRAATALEGAVDAPQFITALNSQAFSSSSTGSVQDRLRRNVHYLQKSGLDKDVYTRR